MSRHDQNTLTRQQWVMPSGGGNLESLKLQCNHIHKPGYGEVCVKVEVVGLNFADIFTGFGLYSPISSGEISGSIVPGLEFSGVVQHVGQPGDVRLDDTLHGAEQMNRGGQLVKLDPRVWALAETHSQSFTVGDRVYGCMRFGACASYVNVPAHQIRKMPNNWNFSQGAAFTAQTLTSYYALKELGNIRSGKVVFIHSLAGGCGMQALKICEKLGASVIGTVGRPEKVLKLLERFPHLSIEQIIVRTTAKELGGQIDTALGYLQHKASIVSHSGIDIVMDAVLGDWFQPVYDRLRPGGRYIVYGAADMTPNSNKLGWNEWLRLGYQWLLRPKLDLLEVPSKNVGVMGFNLIHLLNDAELLLLLMEEMEALSLEPPHVGHEFEFSELVPALSLFRSGKTTGKVVLKV